MNLLRIICKIVGGILVFSGGCGCGIWMAGRKKKRINILRELEQVLIFLYGEIEYAGADIVEIFQRLAEKTDYFQSFFREMGMETGGDQEETLYRLWDRKAEQSPAARWMDKEDLILWKETGKHLGTLDRQTQLQTLQVLQKRLGRQLAEAEMQYDSQARVCRLVGITGGIFTVILLL